MFNLKKIKKISMENKEFDRYGFIQCDHVEHVL